jgi:hypothetical protein
VIFGTAPGKFDSAAGTADHSSFSFHPPDRLFLGGGGTHVCIWVQSLTISLFFSFSFMLVMVLHAKRLRLGNRHLFNGTYLWMAIVNKNVDDCPMGWESNRLDAG